LANIHLAAKGAQSGSLCTNPLKAIIAALSIFSLVFLVALSSRKNKNH